MSWIINYGTGTCTTVYAAQSLPVETEHYICRSVIIVPCNNSGDTTSYKLHHRYSRIWNLETLEEGCGLGTVLPVTCTELDA